MCKDWFQISRQDCCAPRKHLCSAVCSWLHNCGNYTIYITPPKPFLVDDSHMVALFIRLHFIAFDLHKFNLLSRAAMMFQFARQVAESTTELSTLVSLVLLAELKDQLSTNGPFTVFAPTDAAFAALGQETLEVETLKLGVVDYYVFFGVKQGRVGYIV